MCVVLLEHGQLALRQHGAHLERQVLDVARTHVELQHLEAGGSGLVVKMVDLEQVNLLDIAVSGLDLVHPSAVLIIVLRVDDRHCLVVQRLGITVTSIRVKNEDNSTFGGLQYRFQDDKKTLVLKLGQNFTKLKHYTLSIGSGLKGSQGQTFSGAEYKFVTASGVFTLNKILLEDQNFMSVTNLQNVERQNLTIHLEFSEAVDTTDIKIKFSLTNSPAFQISYLDDYKTLNLQYSQDLEGYKKHFFTISTSLRSAVGYTFQGFSNSFFTALDSSLKFPLITDDELLTLVQKQTFKFFYDYAHPVSGMSRERYGSGDIITSGGSGFGVMALIVGMERGFITREEGVTRLVKIVNFLETCDRFHGAWSHWINGSTGAVVPFGTKDNGGDLVETAYMAQGLLAMRQYLNEQDTVGNNLISRITELYNGIE